MAGKQSIAASVSTKPKARLEKSISGSFRTSKLGRKVLFNLPLSLGNAALKLRLPILSLGLMRVPTKYYPANQKILLLREKAHRARGNEDAAVLCQVTRLRLRIQPFIQSKNIVEILKIMAALERTQQTAPFLAGKLISEQLVSEVGRSRILKAARTAQKGHPQSAFLLHLITLCDAMDGNYQDANTLLIDRINAMGDRTDALGKLRFNLLQTSWRVIDLVAREQMDWADSAGGYRNLFDTDTSEPTPDPVTNVAIPAVAATSDVNTKSTTKKTSKIAPLAPVETAVAETNIPPALGPSFKEHALQGRMREEYLVACDADLAVAQTLSAKLNAIRAMMRPGVRHIPSYETSYVHAQKQLEAHAEDFAKLLGPDIATKEAAIQAVLDLCTYLHLACRLKLTTLSKQIIVQLETLSKDKALGFALWPAPAAILKEADDDATAARIIARIKHLPPKNNRDMQQYFSWAAAAREYDAAEVFYKKLPKTLHRKSGLLYYVNILQRRGRFSEALTLLKSVHGQALANPARVNAYSNHTLIKRTGELRFLIETARIYKSVKQPKNPKGVILIAPRNIDHLRRYPLMVLLEFKRRGWAVVPMVEGLLPREMTGDPAIDVMNGAVGASLRFTKSCAAKIPDIKDFVSDPSTGTLRWGDIDLSHSIWEDAAINRRRYTMDYGCPALQSYLAGLAEWTRVMARVVAYAHKQHQKTKRKTAFISLFNHRLPDSMFRFYCEKFGNPDTFFYLHTANGYQNYFTNFSTNVSQRMVLRNMTRYPHVRSASFPLPEFFETYYATRRDKIPEIMDRFASITKVKRSTEGSKGRPPEALDVDRRIAAWRKDGGKVVCAFGKVVCDSSVPFDGGPAHSSMKDWINHCIRTVQGTKTLLLIKPHPHELNNQIATFPTEYFEDILTEPLGKNAILLGHRWFDMHDMEERMDLGLVYNGTTSVELGIMNIPTVLAGHFAPVDYPVGHVSPTSREEFEAYLRFEKKAVVASDLRERSAVWLDYMANENFTQPYRYHTRPVTNKVLYPPLWFKEDLDRHKGKTDPAVQELVGRALGECFEPGGTPVKKLAVPKKAVPITQPKLEDSVVEDIMAPVAPPSLLKKVTRFFKKRKKDDALHH